MPTRNAIGAARAKTPKLGLSHEEAATFRVMRLSARDVATLSGVELHERLKGSFSPRRCEELAALADFQQLGSVGLETARDFVALGLGSVAELKGQDPRELYAKMCELTRSRQDPCVEDAFRCAIAQAESPRLPAKLRDWWRWTSVRGQPMSAKPS